MQSDKPSPTGRRQAIGAAALIASGLAATARTGAAQGVSSPHGPQAGGDSGVYAPGDGALQPNVTPALSAFIGGAATASWPDDIAELARRHILDTLASIIACQPLPPAVLSRNYALSHAAAAAGQGATILGTRQRAVTSEAAFAGAMAGHSAEINDFSPSAFVQPGPSIVSTSLALAEEHDASGKRVLAAVIAGYEIGCRLPKALGLRNLRRAGIANHCIGSLFGSATAAAVMLGLPASQVPSLLTYCSEQASGSWQWLLDTDHIEKAFVFAGAGARNGIHMAQMAASGFTGVHDNLDRRRGWLDSGTFRGPDSDLDRAYLIEQLGVRFELPLVAYKRYAAGGPTQAGVEGLLDIVATVDRSDITHVLIQMPDMDVDAFAHAEVPALNLPYMCALILTDGKLDFDALQSRARIDDPAIRKRMAQIEMVPDPSQVRVPRVESSRVTVTLSDGTTQSTFVEYVLGYPTRPLSHDQVEQKALELMTPRIGAERAQKVVALAWQMDRLPRMNGLIEAMAV